MDHLLRRGRVKAMLLEQAPVWSPRTGMCLAWSVRERAERGVYAASAWRNPSDVAVSPERQESADGEAA